MARKASGSSGAILYPQFDRRARASRRGLFADAAFGVDLVKLHRDALADALLLHGDAVEDVGDLHRALVVRDDDELALVEELLDDQIEALVVRLIKRRVHLVEDAERAGLALEDAHQQRDAG